jgi:hypothetical protein
MELKAVKRVSILSIADRQLRDDYLKRLGEAGINIERTIATGQLEVRPWEEAYLRGDHFDQDAMLALAEEVFKSSAASGYPLTRLVAHMEWALLDKPGVDNLIEYEARVNYLLSKYYAPVICAYDLSKFSASDHQRHANAPDGDHRRGSAREPILVPPDQLLVEIREQRSARKGASTAS